MLPKKRRIPPPLDDSDSWFDGEPRESREQRTYERAPEGTQLRLPSPAGEPHSVKKLRRVKLPAAPGKRPDGKLWFEGPLDRPEAHDHEETERLAKLVAARLPSDPTAPRPRDVRRGDKWLPWHFKKADKLTLREALELMKGNK